MIRDTASAGGSALPLALRSRMIPISCNSNQIPHPNGRSRHPRQTSSPVNLAVLSPSFWRQKRSSVSRFQFRIRIIAVRIIDIETIVTGNPIEIIMLLLSTPGSPTRFLRNRSLEHLTAACRLSHYQRCSHAPLLSRFLSRKV